MPADLSPQICGLWDGCNLWAQWERVEGATYLFEWRVRPDGGWRPVQRKGGLRRSWLVLPTWLEGKEIEARVAIVADGEPDWQTAREVTFSKSRCRFEIRSERSPLHLPLGSRLTTVVDGAACSYVIGEEVGLQPGESVEVDAEAIDASGFQQLDAPDHFLSRPRPGVLIRNVAPSVADTFPTGRNYTAIRGREVAAFMLAVRKASVI